MPENRNRYHFRKLLIFFKFGTQLFCPQYHWNSARCCSFISLFPETLVIKSRVFPTSLGTCPIPLHSERSPPFLLSHNVIDLWCAHKNKVPPNDWILSRAEDLSPTYRQAIKNWYMKLSHEQDNRHCCLHPVPNWPGCDWMWLAKPFSHYFTTTPLFVYSFQENLVCNITLTHICQQTWTQSNSRQIALIALLMVQMLRRLLF